VLQSLSINNYALIETLNMNFQPGFTILTGETGAGKSIILGAIGLILGQRADTSVLRNKLEKCTVEGIFRIKDYGLEPFFETNELDFDEQAILRREISPTGKSRAFINDTPVNVSLLRELGLKLMDIHSQHQNLELNEKHFQLKLVDLVAGNEALLKEYAADFKTYLSLQGKLAETQELAAQSKADLDYFEFQFRQLDEARLTENEQEQLEARLEQMTHAEEIQTVFGHMALALAGDEPNILATLKESMQQIGKLQTVWPGAADLFRRMESCYYELKDLAEEAESIAEKVEHDPEKIQIVTQRLDLIYSLQQKHRVGTVAELLALKNEFGAKIQQVSSYDQQIETLQKELEVQKSKLTKLAGKLRESRKSASKPIEQRVIDVLQNLGIPNAAFRLNFRELPDFSPTGSDEISFLFSANRSQELQEISKIASGGEMSRLMLAVKTLVTSAKALPTIVFDEIDTGISGEVALKMGAILKQLSKTVQVINITHLPQIAAKGDQHFHVFKYDLGDQTFSSIRELGRDERLKEIATMLSGENYTETAIIAAQELLQ
jgi:DNA repair protein RecN (Recombination protein N)